MRGRAKRPGNAAALVPPDAPDDSATLGDIAGYRVLRRLAVGRNAAVYLGHAPAAVSGSTVALRVFHLEADPERVDREIAVRSALPAGVAPTLHDVVTLPDGRICLVVERDDGPTLGELLRRGAQLRAGEAVTILAPLTVALDGVHRRGWSHGAVTPGAVRFDGTGRAHLADWSHARPLAAGAERTRVLRAEYAGLLEVSRAVCAVVDRDSAGPQEVEELVAWLGERVSAHPFLPCAAELERRLFALARPLAVRLDAESASAEAEGTTLAVPLRLAAGEPPPAAQPTDASIDEPDRAPSPLWAGWGLPDAVGRAAGLVRAALRRRLLAHRRAVVVAAALAGAFFVLAITLLPPGEGMGDAASEAAGPVAGAAPAARAEQSAALEEEQAEEEQVQEEQVEGVEAPDPVEAAIRLLALREGCFRESSLLCLDGVLDSGGPLAAEDTADIRRAQQGGTALVPTAFDPASLSLVEQNGGAALLALTTTGDNAKPASLLIIRSEAGWRLRELLDY